MPARVQGRRMSPVAFSTTERPSGSGRRAARRAADDHQTMVVVSGKPVLYEWIMHQNFESLQWRTITCRQRSKQ